MSRHGLGRFRTWQSSAAQKRHPATHSTLSRAPHHDSPFLLPPSRFLSSPRLLSPVGQLRFYPQPPRVCRVHVHACTPPRFPSFLYTLLCHLPSTSAHSIPPLCVCTRNNDADDVNDRSFLVALHRANDTTGKGNTLLVPFGIAFQKKQCLVRYLNISPPRHRVAFLYLRFSCKSFFAPLGRTRATSTHISVCTDFCSLHSSYDYRLFIPRAFAKCWQSQDRTLAFTSHDPYANRRSILGKNSQSKFNRTPPLSHPFHPPTEIQAFLERHRSSPRDQTKGHRWFPKVLHSRLLFARILVMFARARSKARFGKTRGGRCSREEEGTSLPVTPPTE